MKKKTEPSDLLSATMMGRNDLALAAIDRGTNLDQRDRDGRTSLFQGKGGTVTTLTAFRDEITITQQHEPLTRSIGRCDTHRLAETVPSCMHERPHCAAQPPRQRRPEHSPAFKSGSQT